MATYLATLYNTMEDMEAAVEAIATTTTHLVVPYKEDCQTKYMVIVPSPNKYTP